MADHRGDPGVVEVVGDEDRGVGVGVVVAGDQLEPLSVDAACGVDLLRRQLRGQLHRETDRDR